MPRALAERRRTIIPSQPADPGRSLRHAEYLFGGRSAVSRLRAGAVSAHYLPSLGYEPRDAVSGIAGGF
jgi:hypothetical protein